MKKFIYALLFIAGYASAYAADDIRLPVVEQATLSNGIAVMYIRDDLPRMTLSASVCTGYLYEPQASAGGVDIAARMLNISGTKKYPAQALSDIVESTGSRFSVRPDWETMSINFQTLEDNAELACETVSGLLAGPAFKPADFELARSLALEKISREREDPMMAAYALGRGFVFGGKGYGVRATAASVSALTLDGVQQFWRSSVRSGNMIIAVSSSRSLKELTPLLEKYFSGIEKGLRVQYQSINPGAETKKLLAGKIFFIERDIPQATIVFCSPAPDLRDEGMYALRLADEILGGGEFNSKLTREIREKRGLAYSAGSIVRMRRNAGIFIAYSHCDADKTGQTFALMNQCVDETAQGDFTDAELELAKQSLSRSYIFEFDSPLSILSHYVSLWYNGFDESYLKNYPAMLQKQDKDALVKNFRRISGGVRTAVVIGRKEARASLSGMGDIVNVPDGE